MSVEVMALVFKHIIPALKTDDGKNVPDSTAKFVLLALADHASGDGENAYIGIRRIIAKTQLSTSTVCNALNALRHNGYIKLVGKSRADTNNYTINIERFQPVEFQPVESNDSSHWNGTALATRAEPLINHKINHKAAKPQTPFEVSLFRQATSKYPNKANYADVVTAVQKIAARLERPCTVDDLLPFYSAWTARGFNPSNMNWLLEWAVSGTMQQGKQAQNTSDRMNATDEGI